MVDPTLTAALGQDGAYFFGAVRIALPSRPLLLLDGAGELRINGEVYLGEDPEFGTINSIDQITEALGEQAPELLLSLYPKNGVAATVLANPAMQGSVVQIICGAIDPATGFTIGQPEIRFLGEVDVPTLTIEHGRRTVDFSIISVFERLFEVDEGVRAADGWHQSIWPGERGFEYVTGTDKNLYWGSRRPVGQTASSGFGGSASFVGGGETFQNNRFR